jgi:hypothetical protein
LSAVDFSVKPGGHARGVSIKGGLIAHGADISPSELHGTLEAFEVVVGFSAAGGLQEPDIAVR